MTSDELLMSMYCVLLSKSMLKELLIEKCDVIIYGKYIGFKIFD